LQAESRAAFWIPAPKLRNLLAGCLQA
jgi:hypothetical protein